MKMIFFDISPTTEYVAKMKFKNVQHSATIFVALFVYYFYHQTNIDSKAASKK